MLHFGELDGAIPLEQVDEIAKAHPDVDVHVYEGAQHGFSCDAAWLVPSAVGRDRARAHARLLRRQRRQAVIIDCHGHYTTAPPQLGQYRDAQKAALRDDPGPRR